MKKFINLFFILALVAIGFTSCEEKEETPNGIPGMGYTPGELEIEKPFVVPEGITITGLEGLEDVPTDVQTQLKSSQYRFFRRGCGGSFFRHNFRAWITVKLIFQNSSSDKRCITLPPGLVFEVNKPGYQHGITIAPIEVCIKGNSASTVSLYLMCINKGKDGSDTNVKYSIKGVTGAKKILRLINRLKNKKVNWQDYINSLPSTHLKSTNADEIEKYREVADAIQNDIWTLTNDGVDLSKEQIEYIESIPMLVDVQ
jgi:hypothetical protein